MSRSTIGGEGGCHNFVPVLGGGGTEIDPSGDFSNQSSCKMS